jgi:hypothetical protein
MVVPMLSRRFASRDRNALSRHGCVLGVARLMAGSVDELAMLGALDVLDDQKMRDADEMRHRAQQREPPRPRGDRARKR